MTNSEARKRMTTPPVRIDREIHDAIDAEFARVSFIRGGHTPRSHSMGDLPSLALLVSFVGGVAEESTCNDGADLAPALIEVAATCAAWAERLMVRGDA